MKRGWKIFWIIIAVLTGLGIMCGAIALGMGLSIAQIKEEYPHGIGFVGEMHDDDDDMEIHREPSDEVQEFSNISNLKMNVGFCSVQILASHDGKARVDTSELEFHDSEKMISVREEDGTLLIEMCKNGKVCDVDLLEDGNHDYGTLYVYLPTEEKLDTAELKFGAVDVDVESMKVTDLQIQVGAADCSFDKLEVEELYVAVGAGELEISGIIYGNADIQCGVGSVELDLEGNEKDFNYAVKCGVGTIGINDSQEFSGIAKEKQINNGSNKNMTLTCGVGEIEVYFYSQSM